MITTIFKKSTPINTALVLVLMLVFFLMYQFNIKTPLYLTTELLKKGGMLLLLVSALLTLDFITKRNGLSKDSGFTQIFFLSFIIAFPTVLNEIDLLFANFFIILALRRLISLQTLKTPKEKIFDASLWVFIASLFHFWCILFILLVFISIFFHVSRDYRNWILPFLAFFSVGILFLAYTFMFDSIAISTFLANASSSFELNYFTSIYQNLTFSIFTTLSLFFLTSLVLTISNRPLILNSSFKKLISWFLIATVVFVVSKEKSNALLVFTLAPIAVMATCHVEISKTKWQNELTLILVFLFGVFGFFSQL